jgi:hypothetical protein
LGWTTSSGWIAILRLILGGPAVPILSEATLRSGTPPIAAATPLSGCMTDARPTVIIWQSQVTMV